MGRARSLILLLASLLLALVGLGLPSQAVGAPSMPTAVTHSCDDPGHAPDAPGEVGERGPPTGVCTETTYDTDGQLSFGASVRQDGAAIGTATTYDDPGLLVRVARTPATTQGSVRDLDGDLSSISGARSAANEGAHALRAFPKALSGGPANTHVYLGIKNGKPAYAGITTNIGRRSTQLGYYAETLTSHDEALAFLARRKIDHP